MKLDTAAFRSLFFEEATEHLETMETNLLRLDEVAGDPEVLNAIFRGAHTIKGSSGSFGLTDIAQFTHALESVLDRLRNAKLASSPDLTGTLLRATDVLKCLVANAQGGPPPAPQARAAVEGELAKYLDARPAAAREAAAAPASPSGTRRWHIRFVPDPELFVRGGDPLLVLRDLGEAGEAMTVTTLTDRLPGIADLDPERCNLGFEIVLASGKSEHELRDLFAFVEDGSEIGIAAEAAASAPGAGVEHREPARERSSIRVPTEKVDTIINLVGELVIAQAMIFDAMRKIGGEGASALREAVNAMERNTRELQDRVMSVRMMPLAGVFQRFPRLVRDLSNGLGKAVDLRLLGEEIELDKCVIEGLGDPLLHLIRNAIDHGIEAPEARRAAGKPERGTISIAAAHRGGTVQIQVSDDGRGLDRERVRKKAIERGLIDPAAELGPEQIDALIFLPGFSTSEKVSDVSGRGVGMDVVKRGIEALNGSVALSSQPGRGTTCEIKLPLTLAILEGFLLGVGAQCFIIPLVNVVESFLPRPGAVRTVFGRGELVEVRGEMLPLVRLHRVFGLAEPAAGERCLITVVEHGARRIGLVVDELLGQSQVVLKSLETNYRRVEGISGATILGDGRVALILDLLSIIRSATASDALRAA